MTDQEILDSLKYGERINLECKKAESKIPSSVWETYSSFANTNGGLILFGVEEHNKEKDPDKRFTLEYRGWSIKTKINEAINYF